jgi:hypothetical protein
MGVKDRTAEARRAEALGLFSNILGKLHLTDRTQAAVFAWREGIVRRE